MKLKRTLSLLLAVVMTTLIFPLGALGLNDGNWIFISGENITRQTDMAVIYRGVETTGQNQWGHDIIVGGDGRVMKIITAGNAEGENLAVPVDGYVISASGSQVDWFKRNVRVGTLLSYDAFGGKLFLANADGTIDPYFSKTADVKKVDGGYAIVTKEEASVYGYTVAVDKDGYVTECGIDAVAPEGGFTVEANDNDSRDFLMAYAHIGVLIKVDGSKATFTFESRNLKKMCEIALDNAKEALAEAKSGYLNIDIEALEAVISENKSTSSLVNYKLASEYVLKLSSAVKALSVENVAGELRGAEHIPTETNESEVRATVKKAKNAGLNTIILKATNGYGTFIPLPEGNRFSQDAKYKGFDVLQSFIEVCESEGIALTLAIDVYYNEQASIKAPEWLSKPNGEEQGMTNRFFSPANTEFKKYFIEYVEYIVKNYRLDSIMFDYLRYPKFSEQCDLGYDNLTIQRFSEECQVPINEADLIKTELFNSKHWSSWIKFRTSLVSDMAHSLAETVRASSVNTEILAVAQRDTVDYYYCQDSLGWAVEELFDGIVLSFSEGDALENDVIDANAYYDGIITEKCKIMSAYTGKHTLFFTELETSGSQSNSTVTDMISEARAIGSEGIIFDSLSEFLAQNRAGALNGVSESPLGDSERTAVSILDSAKSRLELLLESKVIDEKSHTSAIEKLDKAIALFEKSPITHSDASKLETDMSLIFAQNDAKQAILSDFKRLTKIALIRELEEEIIDDTSTEESSIPEESIESEPVSVDSSPESVSETPTESSDEGGFELNIDVGELLIYGFVGIAIIASLSAMIVGIRRKNAQPKNRHMPRASQKESENSEDGD